MRKFIAGFLVGAMLFSVVGVAAVTYVAYPAGFKVLVNGEEFKSDPPAVVIDGSTYLPLRAMGNALGVPVNWNAELQQAEVGNSDVNKAIVINDKVSVDGMTFSQLTLKYQEMLDIFECAVEVTNNSGKSIEGMMFKITFFDKKGTRLGIAELGTLSNGLKNGETKTAQLYSDDNIANAATARYEITYIY